MKDLEEELPREYLFCLMTKYIVKNKKLKWYDFGAKK